ncbi:MAG: hypothetical protein IID46_01470 [Planctomycetes bacterium]|nr:hypothetical protein [Planctomycetota bacterium]
MKRRMMWMSVIALVISLVAADVGQAQQKGGNRGGRSRGGFGGFGGRGGSQGPVSLVGNSNVQKELGLSQAQIAAVTKLTAAYREEQRSARGNFDLVFLKNVLIYFDRDSKAVVLKNIHAAMAKGGLLLAGAAEGVSDLMSEFQRIESWLYRKP